jgi:hypothetical protein
VPELTPARGGHKVLSCAVFEPRNRSALLAIKRRLGSCKARRLLQIFMKPPADRIVMFFFMRVELSRITEIHTAWNTPSARSESSMSATTNLKYIPHPNCSSAPRGDVAPCQIHVFYSRKEIVAAATVVVARQHATFLETAAQNRTDRDRLVRASPEALCLRGRSYVRA